jgi:DNA primase
MWNSGGAEAMFDREAILAAVDLPALADELLGPGRGSRHSPTWRCPSPDHPQTGRTPPVSVFTARDGEQRWHCHGCGNGGTAVDLVMQVRSLTAREALAELATRTGVPEVSRRVLETERTRRGDQRHSPSALYLAPPPVPELKRYVPECAKALWTAAGTPVRRWMTEVRRIPEDVLEVNAIGADLGWRRQDRPSGVPRVRGAVVLPVLVAGQPCHVQLRILGAGPGFPKYLSCNDALARNPRIGLYGPAPHLDSMAERPELIVTEGIIDALSAAAGGFTAAAVLGAEHAGAVTAVALARVPRPLVIAFDPDAAGRAATERLVQGLSARHRPPHVLQLRDGDLNENLVRSGDWLVEMAARVDHATFSRSPPGLARGIS